MKRLAAGGFKDITRIASSSPVMWEQICMTNTGNITEVLDRYIDSLTTLREELSDHQSKMCIRDSKKKDGSLKSNIVPFIPGGSTVSAPRTMIQYVATEYGIAKLTGLTLKERADAMIAIAHPDFRDELRRYAEENFK